MIGIKNFKSARLIQQTIKPPDVEPELRGCMRWAASLRQQSAACRQFQATVRRSPKGTHWTRRPATGSRLRDAGLAGKYPPAKRWASECETAQSGRSGR